VFTTVVFLDLLLLGSRTAILVFAIIVVYYWLKASTRSRILQRLLIIVAVFLSVTFIFIPYLLNIGLVSGWFANYYYGIIEGGSLIDSSLQQRIDYFWRTNIELFMTHPLFGLVIPERDIFLGDGEIFWILRSYGIFAFIFFVSNFIADAFYARKELNPLILLSIVVIYEFSNGIFFWVIGTANFYYVVLIYICTQIQDIRTMERSRKIANTYSTAAISPKE